jgi:hypothetical protein
MRIVKPRSPAMVVLKGRERPKVGPAQHAALGLLMKFGASEEPPKGTLSPTGFMRQSVLDGMIPLGWVKAKVLHSGTIDYLITAQGRNAHKNGIVQDAPKSRGRKDGRESSGGTVKATSGLLARQRARAAAKRAQTGNGRDTGRRAATG